MSVQRKRAQDARTNGPLVRRVLEQMARQRREEAKRIGARIAVLRDRSHLTQEAAAAKLKVGVRTYQTWEAGDATPRWQNYERLAKLYGVAVEDILGSTSLNGSQAEAAPPALAEIQATLEEISARLERLERRRPLED